MINSNLSRHKSSIMRVWVEVAFDSFLWIHFYEGLTFYYLHGFAFHLSWVRFSISSFSWISKFSSLFLPSLLIVLEMPPRDCFASCCLYSKHSKETLFSLITSSHPLISDKSSQESQSSSFELGHCVLFITIPLLSNSVCFDLRTSFPIFLLSCWHSTKINLPWHFEFRCVNS